jgi:hypothetical protein
MMPVSPDDMWDRQPNDSADHPFSDQWAMRISSLLSPNREEDTAMTATTPLRVFRLQLVSIRFTRP